MIFEHGSYRTFLRDLMVRKKEVNSLYSLRSMARSLGLAHSTLSELLVGKVNLSLDKALGVSAKLRLTEEETEYFLLLVQFEDTKSPQLKAQLRRRLDLLNDRVRGVELPPEEFDAFGDWYYVAILTLAHTQGGLHSAREITERLGLAEPEAQRALARLESQELLRRDARGAYRMSEKRVRVSASGPNATLQQFHARMLERASESLPRQAPTERVIASETFPMSSALIPEANRLADEYLDQLLKLSRTRDDRDEVYHAGVQIFRLTEPRRSAPEATS